MSLDVNFYYFYYDDLHESIKNNHLDIKNHYQKFGRNENRIPNQTFLKVQCEIIHNKLFEQFTNEDYKTLCDKINIKYKLRG